MTLFEGVVPRMLPGLIPQNRAFWTGGARGELLIRRCQDCRRWTHPESDRCSGCGGELRPEPVSGKGTVFTFTVNMHQFHPDVPPPNMIAIVELDEQDDLRLPSNIVGCEFADLRCGLPVKVAFEHNGEYFVPVFEPDRSDR